MIFASPELNGGEAVCAISDERESRGKAKNYKMGRGARGGWHQHHQRMKRYLSISGLAAFPNCNETRLSSFIIGLYWWYRGKSDENVALISITTQKRKYGKLFGFWNLERNDAEYWHWANEMWLVARKLKCIAAKMREGCMYWLGITICYEQWRRPSSIEVSPLSSNGGKSLEALLRR